jgi:hypothetical protein
MMRSSQAIYRLFIALGIGLPIHGFHASMGRAFAPCCRGDQNIGFFFAEL